MEVGKLWPKGPIPLQSVFVPPSAKNAFAYLAGSVTYWIPYSESINKYKQANNVSFIGKACWTLVGSLFTPRILWYILGVRGGGAGASLARLRCCRHSVKFGTLCFLGLWPQNQYWLQELVSLSFFLVITFSKSPKRIYLRNQCNIAEWISIFKRFLF